MDFLLLFSGFAGFALVSLLAASLALPLLTAPVLSAAEVDKDVAAAEALRKEAEAKLADLTDVTHIFYAAFQAASGAAAGYASNIAPNRDLLANAVTAIARVSKVLRRVVLVTGTKYYGTHLGPFKTPARETDPRHMPPD